MLSLASTFQNCQWLSFYSRRFSFFSVIPVVHSGNDLKLSKVSVPCRCPIVWHWILKGSPIQGRHGSIGVNSSSLSMKLLDLGFGTGRLCCTRPPSLFTLRHPDIDWCPYQILIFSFQGIIAFFPTIFCFMFSTYISLIRSSNSCLISLDSSCFNSVRTDASSFAWKEAILSSVMLASFFYGFLYRSQSCFEIWKSYFEHYRYIIPVHIQNTSKTYYHSLFHPEGILCEQAEAQKGSYNIAATVYLCKKLSALISSGTITWNELLLPGLGVPPGFTCLWKKKIDMSFVVSEPRKILDNFVPFVNCTSFVTCMWRDWAWTHSTSKWQYSHN